MTNTVDVASGPKKGPPFRPSLAVLLVGILLALPGMAIFGVALFHDLNGPTYRVPGTARMHLGSGTYVVFEHTGNTQNYGPLTIRHNNGVTIDATQVHVTGPDGTEIDTWNTSADESIDLGSDHYVSVVKLDVPESGDYTLRFDTTTAGEVMINRPFGDLFTRRAPWLVAVGTGWLVALIGMTMLLTGVLRRGRADRKARTAPIPGFAPAGAAPTDAAPASWVAPAAWYADPDRRRRLRYWDGERWTDHYAD